MQFANRARFLGAGRSTAVLAVLYTCAGLQFIRFYVRSTTFYLNMQAYLDGHERLPFQERVLPILILKPLTESSWVRTHLVHSTGVFTLQRGPFYLLSLVAFAVAAIYTQRLYNALTTQNLLQVLVFPAFLFVVMFTYAIHNEADYSYPYDLPSLAFFTAGVFYLYQRRFLPFFLIVLVGTFNRETTLFLIGLYVIDACTVEPDRHSVRRFDLRQLSWLRASLLLFVWVAIRLALAHRFVDNDSSESFLRIHYNLDRLRPRLVPALLNMCGYSLPMVVILNRFLTPERFRNYLWILPVWLGVAFCSGVLIETRIYGELCSFSAVALVLILERTITLRMAQRLEFPEALPRTERLAA